MKKGNYFSTVLIVSVVAVLILLLAVGFTGNVILKSSFLKNKNGGSSGSSTIQPVSSPVVSDVTSEECVGGGCEFNPVGEDSTSDSLPSVDVAAQEAECMQYCESNKAAAFPGCRNTLVSRFASLFGANVQILLNAGISCASLSCSKYCSGRTVGGNTVRTKGAVVGEWTNDLEAAKTLAREKNSFVIITFSSTSCIFCNSLESATYKTKEFKNWAKENNVALVYSTNEKTKELQDSLYRAYLSEYPSVGLPYVFIIDGNGTLFGKFVARDGTKNNGITLKIYPESFIRTVKSFIPCIFSLDSDEDGYGGGFGKFIINGTNCMPFNFTHTYEFGEQRSNKMICQCGGVPAGYVNNSFDCNDTNAAVNPDAKEVCRDYIDNDCNEYRDFDSRTIMDPSLFVDEKYGKVKPSSANYATFQRVWDCYANYSY